MKFVGCGGKHLWSHHLRGWDRRILYSKTIWAIYSDLVSKKKSKTKFKIPKKEKGEKNNFFYRKMGRTGNHHVKQSKSDSEVSHVFFYVETKERKKNTGDMAQQCRACLSPRRPCVWVDIPEIIQRITDSKTAFLRSNQPGTSGSRL
jgi:hypothetical protein